MATSKEYAEFVCGQISAAGVVESRPMMGEYIIYIDGKCVMMVCDEICYVKKIAEIEELMAEAEVGAPYPGAKEHYILDIEHKDQAVRVLHILAQVLPYPKKKKKK